MYLQLLRQKDPKSIYDLEFIGHNGAPPPAMYSKVVARWTPEKLVCLSPGDLVVMEREASFFLASSQTHASLLVTWGNWDNSVIVRSIGPESRSIRLHHHPLNKVREEEEEE